MDFDWSKKMDADLKERMDEVEQSMEGMEYGVMKYLKRKANGGLNYMYAFKTKEGEIDYILKSGEPTPVMDKQVRRAVYAAHKNNETFTEDDTSEESEQESVDLLNDPKKDERKLESNKMKTKEEEEQEEKDEEDKNSKASMNLLTQKSDVNFITPTKKRKKVPLTDSMILCGHCFNEDCHSYRYGKFLAFVTHVRYNGNFEEEKETLKKQFKEAYHSIREWDKVQKFQQGVARPVDAEDIHEDLPECLLRFQNMWLEKLRIRFNNANGTFADPFK